MENNAKKDYQMATLNELFGEYTVATIDEYFNILDREESKRSTMVAKSLVKYLKKAQANKKSEEKLAVIY